MKYNPAEAAVVWYGGGHLTVRDSSGKKLYSMQCSEREADAEMDALKTTGLFQSCGTHKIAINTHQAGHVYYRDDEIRFQDKKRNDFVTFKMSAEDGTKILNAIAEGSPAWIRVPGYMANLNANALSSVKLKGDVVEFLDLDGKVWETSTPMGNDIAAPLITKTKAAIDACKSVKTVAASGGVAAPAPAAAKPTKEERLKLKELFNTLKENVFGQDDPLEALAQAVKRARAGLQEENKPMGGFLFLGPTGVGKTEAARALAKALGYDFKKFDMSEYVSKWDASRLVGGSPNYVGYEDGGQLTNFVRDHQKSVLLFDEIEKAHPDVANLLLQVLDDAQLTDGKGRTVVFKDTVIILTSNLGTGYTAQKSIGFTAGLNRDEKEPDEARTSNEVKSFFLAEFVNRLTDVIRFKPLTPEVMLKMVDKFVGELADRAKKQDTELTVTPAARKHLAEAGYDEDFGARPLKRELEKATNELADEMLFGALENGGKATLDAEKGKDGKMKLTYRFNEAASNDNKLDASPEFATSGATAKAATPSA